MKLLFVENDYVEVLALFPCLLLLSGLLITVISDSYTQKKQKRTMIILIAFTFSLVFQNWFENRLATGEPEIMLRTIFAIYGYSVRPLIIVLLMNIVEPEKDYRWAWILTAVNAAVHMTALFSSVCFTISEDNHFSRGLPVLRSLCLIVSMLFLAYLTWISYKRIHTDRRYTWLLFFAVFTILLAISFDGNVGSTPQPVTFLTIAMVIDCVLYYIWLHSRFVAEHEEDLKAQQRIRIMVSQIQPHFLFNTLTTIQSFCLSDPEKAFDITEKFGSYLRQNLDSLGKPDLIPIEEELRHTKVYAEIEKTRFPDINIRYDIWDTDFSIPVLTIQPLVENAIRHGVRIREEGLVEVKTRRLNGYHEVAVSDNGGGFDVSALEDIDETHVGLRNVRERIEKMCGGTLSIKSAINEGTEVTIRIPAAVSDDITEDPAKGESEI